MDNDFELNDLILQYKVYIHNKPIRIAVIIQDGSDITMTIG